MDGVLVHENRAIPGAAELIAQWEAKAQPYLVLTNNSIFTARDLSARLAASGIKVPEDRDLDERARDRSIPRSSRSRAGRRSCSARQGSSPRCTTQRCT